MTLLAVQDLGVSFPVDGRALRAVDGIDYRIAAGETLGIVGESGSGKTAAALAILGLLPRGAEIAGSVALDGRPVPHDDPVALQRIRGAAIAMVFQDPASALNPVLTIGDQVAEPLLLHQGMTAAVAAEEAVAWLERVGLPNPRAVAARYPHELSGGMRQRATIAMALIARPKLLIADEPTTALDVTVQARILDLLLTLQRDTGIAIQFISHNLAVVSEVADRIAVMYAGRIVEEGDAAALLAAPAHPYTRALLDALPRPGRRTPPGAIGGTAPGLADRPPGCAFAPRCPLGDAACTGAPPPLAGCADGRRVACYKVPA